MICFRGPILVFFRKPDIKRMHSFTILIFFYYTKDISNRLALYLAQNGHLSFLSLWSRLWCFKEGRRKGRHSSIHSNLHECHSRAECDEKYSPTQNSPNLKSQILSQYFYVSTRETRVSSPGVAVKYSKKKHGFIKIYLSSLHGK